MAVNHNRHGAFALLQAKRSAIGDEALLAAHAPGERPREGGIRMTCCSVPLYFRVLSHSSSASRRTALASGLASPGLRGGGIQCCVRVQAGPRRAGVCERVCASSRGADARAAQRAVAARACRLERGPALAAGAARHHRGLPAYLELGLRSRHARAARHGSARAMGGQGHALSLALRVPAAVPGRHPSEPARAHRLHRAARRRVPSPPVDVARARARGHARAPNIGSRASTTSRSLPAFRWGSASSTTGGASPA